MSRSNKVIYLTFDDGPIPDVTTFVLKTLKSFQINATFFCIGDNILKHPQLFEQILAEGNQVGNHTFNHLKGWNTSSENYYNNFLKCQNLTNTHLFRPPYGRIKRSQFKQILNFNFNNNTTPEHPKTINDAHKPLILDSKYLPNDLISPLHSPSQMKIIMWDVLSVDYNLHVSPEQCFKNVQENTQNGSIIVFHDSLKAYKNLTYALPASINYLLNQGYSFGLL